MDDRESKRRGVETAVYLDYDVRAQVDSYSKAQDRSRSWMINNMLRRYLGLIPDEGADTFEGKGQK